MFQGCVYQVCLPPEPSITLATRHATLLLPDCSYLPVYHLLVASLTTIQGSFLCSNKVITSGLEMEWPAYKGKKRPQNKEISCN